jgi:hypothetical protein
VPCAYRERSGLRVILGGPKLLEAVTLFLVPKLQLRKREKSKYFPLTLTLSPIGGEGIKRELF